MFKDLKLKVNNDLAKLNDLKCIYSEFEFLNKTNSSFEQPILESEIILNDTLHKLDTFELEATQLYADLKSFNTTSETLLLRSNGMSDISSIPSIESYVILDQTSIKQDVSWSEIKSLAAIVFADNTLYTSYIEDNQALINELTKMHNLMPLNPGISDTLKAAKRTNQNLLELQSDSDKLNERFETLLNQIDSILSI